MTQIGVILESIVLLGRGTKYKKIHYIVGLEECGEVLKNVIYAVRQNLQNLNGLIKIIHINEIVMIGKGYVKNAMFTTI